MIYEYGKSKLNDNEDKKLNKPRRKNVGLTTVFEYKKGIIQRIIFSEQGNLNKLQQNNGSKRAPL